MSSRRPRPTVLAAALAVLTLVISLVANGVHAHAAQAPAWYSLTRPQLTRHRPLLAGRTLPLIHTGTLVKATGRSTKHWLQVTYGSRTSWVLKDNLKPAQPPAPPAPVVSVCSVECMIVNRANQWRVSPSLMLSIARCESGYNPLSYNPSGASGLFQFMPSTFYGYAARIGETRSYWDPDAAANVASYAVSTGGLGNWDASRPCWG
jgi:soluble lytic murein transglycosylase-like protein